MKTKAFSMIWIFLAAAVIAGCGSAKSDTIALSPKGDAVEKVNLEKIVKTDEEWRKILTPEQYRVARGKGTEPPFCGMFMDTKEQGSYHCVCCDLPLFRSDDKFDSGTGWPSFMRPISEERILAVEDRSHGMVRTEVLCRRCDAHLGHVFEDGPPPTGLRYCLNSVSLKFVKDPDTE